MDEPSQIPLLIVEDNPMYAEILQRLLPTLGADLHFASKWVDTAEKAYAELDRTAYHVMLLDYKLPGADGLEVLANVCRLPTEKQPAVIMLTGMGNETIAVEAMKNGAKDYLAKDHLDVPSLVRAITSARERKRLEQQVARYTHELREKNEQMQADLRIAGEVQQALLPQRFPHFPARATAADSSLQFEKRYLPTGTVGGDFFDVLPLSDTAAGVFICDVVGHGVGAALITGLLRALVEENQPVATQPDQFLTLINRQLLGILKQTRMPMFASAFYVIADVARAEIRFANAGHPAPFHLRRAAKTLQSLGGPVFAPGPALGVFDDSQYLSHTQPLAAGDGLVLYTDGLYEVEGKTGDLYGQERLLAAVHDHLALLGPQLLDTLLDEVRQFASTNAFLDDVCLVGLEIKRTGA